MIDENTHVYCTKCKWLRLCDEEIPYCLYSNECDIEDCEDSRPYKERPKYEEHDRLSEVEGLKEIIQYYGQPRRYQNQEIIKKHLKPKKRWFGKADPIGNKMYATMCYVIADVVVQPHLSFISKESCDIDYHKSSGDILTIKIYKNGVMRGTAIFNDVDFYKKKIEFDEINHIIHEFFNHPATTLFDEWHD